MGPLKLDVDLSKSSLSVGTPGTEGTAITLSDIRDAFVRIQESTYIAPDVIYTSPAGKRMFEDFIQKMEPPRQYKITDDDVDALRIPKGFASYGYGGRIPWTLKPRSLGPSTFIATRFFDPPYCGMVYPVEQ